MSLDDSSIPGQPASPADESPAQPPASPLGARVEVAPDLRVPWTLLHPFSPAAVRSVREVRNRPPSDSKISGVVRPFHSGSADAADRRAAGLPGGAAARELPRAVLAHDRLARV